MTTYHGPLREALDYALARDAGGGYVRSTESLSVDVLRGLEVQGFTIAPIAALVQPAPPLDVVYVVVRRDCQDVMAVHATAEEAQEDAGIRMSGGSTGRYRVESWGVQRALAEPQP